MKQKRYVPNVLWHSKKKMIVLSLKLEFRKSKRGFITGRGESVYQKS